MDGDVDSSYAGKSLKTIYHNWRTVARRTPASQRKRRAQSRRGTYNKVRLVAFIIIVIIFIVVVVLIIVLSFGLLLRFHCYLAVGNAVF